MVDLKQLRAEIKASLDRENTAQILSFIGFDVNRNFQFKIRDEKTPSVTIRRDGLIKDFGGDFSGDVVALLHEVKGLPLSEATKYVADCLGVHYE